MKQKHADLIKAWADGAIIEKNNGMGHWIEVNKPDWMDWEIYRIKPEKPEIKIDSKLVYLNLRFTIKREGPLMNITDVELIK
jgi:hypothetical protein